MHRYYYKLFLLYLLCIGFFPFLTAQVAVPSYIHTSEDLESYKQLGDSEDCQFEIKILQGAENLEFGKKLLFVHTLPAFKKINADKYLLECYGNVLKVDKQHFLLLEFVINSENARYAYGKLENDSKIKISFLNDDYIYLENIERDKGKISRKNQQTIYKGVYPLDRSKIKQLRKNRIKKMGVIWEEGFQEYNVINFDLISNQLTCLNDL